MEGRCLSPVDCCPYRAIPFPEAPVEVASREGSFTTDDVAEDCLIRDVEVRCVAVS